MSPIEIAMQVHKKKILVATGIVFSGLWVCILACVLTRSQNLSPVGQSTITIHSASPVATNSVSAPILFSRKSIRPTHSVVGYPTISPTIAPKASVGTGTSKFVVHQTSDKKLRSIGGGNAVGVVTVTGGCSNGHGISYGGNMVMLSASLSLAAPEANKANDIAQLTTAEPEPAGVAPRRLPGHEEEWWLTPVGDVAWGLMALLALAYAGTLYYRKRRAV